jgi:transcription initiation factor IIE alpha subunit
MNNIRRQVSLQCPTCGKTDFQFDEAAGPSGIITCASCGRQLRRDELESYNSELIEAAKREVISEAKQELEQMVHRTLCDAFRGNKFIKIR